MKYRNIWKTNISRNIFGKLAILSDMFSFGNKVWFGVVWCGVVWCGVVWCVCMHAFMHACVCACIRACKHVAKLKVHTHTHTHMRTYVYICTHIYTHIHKQYRCTYMHRSLRVMGVQEREYTNPRMC